jgi:hypothetical protein
MGQITIRQPGEEDIFTLKPDVRTTWGNISQLIVGLASQNLGTTSGPQQAWKIDHLIVRTTYGS